MLELRWLRLDTEQARFDEKTGIWIYNYNVPMVLQYRNIQDGLFQKEPDEWKTINGVNASCAEK